MSLLADFPDDLILKYLDLPVTHEPLPSSEPITFLKAHIQHLPPHLQLKFSTITTPKQRTVIPTIRNRRLKHALSFPDEFQFDVAKRRWPELWDGRERPGREDGKEEKNWVEREFLGGQKGQVGKLGELLGDYEEEREAERVRLAVRRERTRPTHEVETSEDESEGSFEEPQPASAEENAEEVDFLRRIRERFIYGLLGSVDYDSVDWNEVLDADDREAEEKWFNEDDDESPT